MKLLPLLLLPSAYAFFKTSSSSNINEELKVPGDNPLEFCEDPSAGDYSLQIENVDLEPNPPHAGQTLTLIAKGNFTKQVNQGSYVKLTVKLGLIQLLKLNADLCDTLGKVDMPCPVEEGEATITKDIDLPGVIPPGKYTVSADIFNDDDERITCLKAAVSFSRQGAAQKKKTGGDDSIDL